MRRTKGCEYPDRLPSRLGIRCNICTCTQCRHSCTRNRALYVAVRITSLLLVTCNRRYAVAQQSFQRWALLLQVWLGQCQGRSGAAILGREFGCIDEIQQRWLPRFTAAKYTHEVARLLRQKP